MNMPTRITFVWYALGRWCHDCIETTSAPSQYVERRFHSSHVHFVSVSYTFREAQFVYNKSPINQ